MKGSATEMTTFCVRITIMFLLCESRKLLPKSMQSILYIETHKHICLCRLCSGGVIMEVQAQNAHSKWIMVEATIALPPNYTIIMYLTHVP